MLSLTLPCYNNLYFCWKYLNQNVVSGNYSNDTSQHYWMDVRAVINMHTCSNRLLFRLAQQKKCRRRVRAWIEKEQTLLAGEGWGKETKVHPVRERTAFDKTFGRNCRRFLSSPAPLLLTPTFLFARARLLRLSCFVK